jgi:hypothetical protein
MRNWYLKLFVICTFAVPAWAQDCQPALQFSSCGRCPGLMFCGNRTTYFGGPYFDTMSLNWDTIDTTSTSDCVGTSICSPAVSGCVVPPAPAENACIQKTIALSGFCRGVHYTQNHVSCCDLAT